ncbi:MAG TPA: hypothetical protein VIU12_30360 [Chryseolinea sp.]
MKNISFAFYIVSFLLLYTSSANAQWTVASLSDGKYAAGATSVGDKAFFAGGVNAKGASAVVDIYNATDGSWTVAALSKARYALNAAAAGSKALFAGGDKDGFYSDVVDIYDNATNTWTVATLQYARRDLAACSLSSKVFFGGGLGQQGYADVVDIYDTQSNTWTSAKLSVARTGLAAASAGTKVFFAGGVNGNIATYYSDVVDIYDNATDTWTTAKLSQGRESLVATSVGSKVFFAGGSSASGTSNVVDIYDTNTDTWTTTTLSAARTNLTSTSFGQKAFFAGGVPNSSQPDLLDIVDIYDASTDTWTTATLSSPRAWIASASVGKKAIFAGGFSTGPSNVVDLYDDCAGPNLNVSASTSICAGANTTLTATGASTYHWTPALGLSDTQGSVVSASPATTTTYVVTGFDEINCGTSGTVTVTVHPLPVLGVNTATPIVCNGIPADLVVSGASTYTWSPTNGITETAPGKVTANPETTTTYTVTGTDQNNCKLSKDIIVVVSASSKKPAITATNLGEDVAFLISSSPLGNQWFYNGVAIPDAVNQILPASASGQYTVQCTVNGCASVTSDPFSLIILGVGDEKESRSSLLFPNPVVDKAQLNWGSFIKDRPIETTIVDITGRPVSKVTLTTADDRLELGWLSAGIYFFEAVQADQRRIIQFIKTN